MAQDWSTRESCLAALKLNYYDAYIHWFVGISTYGGTQAKIDLLPAGDIKNAIQNVFYVAAGARHSVEHLINYNFGGVGGYSVSYFFEHYTLGAAPEPDPITWQDIIKAWDQMDRAEIMFLVDYLDESRRIVQDDPFALVEMVNPYI